MNTLTSRQLAAVVLAKAALVDSRTPKPDPHVLDAWAEILDRCPPCSVEDAGAAVVEHYVATTERIMPADVVRIVKARVRVVEPPAEPRALPSRFETDAERGERIRKGVQLCRAAIVPRSIPEGDTTDDR